MRLRSLILLLSLFVCAAAFAAPPVITSPDNGNTIKVTVPPGHRIAWIRDGNPEVSGMTADSDNDGVIEIVPTNYFLGVWIVADVETGEWAYWFRWPLDFEPISAGKILPDAAGNFTQIVLARSQISGGGVWVRPGVGAWGATNGTWPSASFLTRGDNVGITTVASLVPLGTSPARPAGFSQGDILLLAGAGIHQSGVVDAAVHAPPSPGTILFNNNGTISSPTEGTTLTLDLARVDGTSGTVSVDVGFDVSAGMEAGVDYLMPESRTVTFGPGETVKKFSLSFPNDSVYTMFQRRMTLSLQQPTNGAGIGAPGAQQVWLSENDTAPSLAFGTLPASVVEGDTPWTFDVPFSLSGAFRGAAEVTFTTFGAPTSRITVNSNAQHFAPLLIAADDLPDPTRTVSFTLSVSYNSINGTLQIVDDDPPSWTTTDVVVRESRYWDAPFPFLLSAAPGDIVELSFATADGTAVAGQDYVAKTSTVRFSGPGYTASIQLVNDSIAESNETFYVDVLSTSGPVQPPTRTRFTVTIIDNDGEPPPMSLIVNDVVEGDSGWKEVPVTVRLASPATSDVTVTVRPGTGGSATAQQDFAAQATSLEFLAGETEKTYSLTVRGDLAVEDVESVVLEAVSRSGAVVATTSFDIIDNDSQSFISVADIEVDETAAEATFVVLFSEAPGTSGSFDYETNQLLASEGADYIAANGKIEFGPNDTRKEIRVQLIDDASVEGNETFALKLTNLTSGPGVYLHRNVAYATIRDNDTTAAPIITLSATSPLEGNSGQKSVPITVRLAAVVATPVEVAILTQQGTAGAGTDYVPLSTSVTFQPGETEKQVTVNILGDTLGEGDETLTITASYEGTIAASMTLTIRDDDTIYYVAVSDTGVVEGTGNSSTASFKINFLPPPPNGGTLHYETENDTANNTDYAATSGTLAFEAGNSSLSIPVEVFGDATGEKDERFRLRISNPTGGVKLFDDLGVATIYDDDGAIVRPTLSIEDVAVIETNSASEARFTLRLSKASETNVSVHYATEDQSARAGADYETRSGTLTFAPGQTTKTIVVPIVGDTTHEDAETFTVQLSNGNGAVIPDLQATCTITDDDPAEEKRTKRRTSRH